MSKKSKVTRKAAAERVKNAPKAKAAPKKPKPAPKAKAAAANQPMPEGVTLLQPPSGEVAVVGTVLQVGRRKYGGNYFGRLSAENYQLAEAFMTKVIKAIKGAEGKCTPSKLLLNVPNAHGTPTRVFAVESNAGNLQLHVRYFTQGMFDKAHKAKVQVFGNRVKGETIGGTKVTTGTKAHSNSIHLTPETMGLCVELAQAKAASL